MTFRFHSILALVAGSLLMGVARADLQDELDARIGAADLKETVIAFMVMDLESNAMLAQRNPDALMIPASNMKLFTTASALGVLGPQFNFQTELRLLGTNPNAAVVVVRGDGDPAFGDPQVLAKTPMSALKGTPYEGHKLDVELFLRIWVDQIKRAHARRVVNLVIDDRMFDRQVVHPTWPADQLHRWYCAQVAGLNFFTNCVEFHAEPTVPGQTPRIRMMPHTAGFPFLTITNRSVTGDADTFWAGRRIGSNQFILAGKVRSQRRAPAEVTVHDPSLFFGHVLASRLVGAGIPVNTVTRPGVEQPLLRGRLLHTMRTPIADVINRCNKSSQNLYAEALIKRMGRHITGAPGSWSNGAAAMRIFLRQKLGTQAARVQPVDGSGMSRNNRITARSTVALLQAMHRDSRLGGIWKKSLAVAGSDGALRTHFTTNMRSRVYGKTGYINGVRTLSGYLEFARKDKLGKSLPPKLVAFSLLFNNIKPPVYSHHILKLRDQLVRIIDQKVQ